VGACKRLANGGYFVSLEGAGPEVRGWPWKKRRDRPCPYSKATRQP